MWKIREKCLTVCRLLIGQNPKCNVILEVLCTTQHLNRLEIIQMCNYHQTGVPLSKDYKNPHSRTPHYVLLLGYGPESLFDYHYSLFDCHRPWHWQHFPRDSRFAVKMSRFICMTHLMSKYITEMIRGSRNPTIWSSAMFLKLTRLCKCNACLCSRHWPQCKQIRSWISMYNYMQMCLKSVLNYFESLLGASVNVLKLIVLKRGQRFITSSSFKSKQEIVIWNWRESYRFRENFLTQ